MKCLRCNAEMKQYKFNRDLEYTEKNTIPEMDMLLDKILIIHTAYMNAPNVVTWN